MYRHGAFLKDFLDPHNLLPFPRCQTLRLELKLMRSGDAKSKLFSCTNLIFFQPHKAV